MCLIGQWPNEVEHVFCVLDVTGSTWTSADYGQRLPEYGYRPSSGIRTRVQQGSKLGDRTIVGWIDIEYLPLVASPDLTGVPHPWPGEGASSGGGGGSAGGGGGASASSSSWGQTVFGATLLGALSYVVYRLLKGR